MNGSRWRQSVTEWFHGLLLLEVVCKLLSENGLYHAIFWNGLRSFSWTLFVLTLSARCLCRYPALWWILDYLPTSSTSGGRTTTVPFNCNEAHRLHCRTAGAITARAASWARQQLRAESEERQDDDDDDAAPVVVEQSMDRAIELTEQQQHHDAPERHNKHA